VCWVRESEGERERMTLEQDNRRKEDSIKVLISMLNEQKAYYKNQPPKDLNRRFEYDLKIMALSEGIGALGRQMNQVSISFPALNNLTPTVESCTMKLIEELGELLQIIGKGNQMSGELPRLKTGERNPLRLIEEAFDVAQSAVTMIYTVAEKWDIDIEYQRELHEKKLRDRGYLK